MRIQVLIEAISMKTKANKGENYMQKLDELGRDELFYKIVDKEYDKAIKMLDSVTNVDFQDNNGTSYLHVAIQASSVEITQKILDKGANIEIRDKFGKTPLIVAIIAYGGDDSIIKLLIEKGACKEAKTDAGMSCLQIAEMKGIEL